MFPYILIGVAVFALAIIHFIHELRWVNSQRRDRPWGSDEDGE